MIFFLVVEATQQSDQPPSTTFNHLQPPSTTQSTGPQMVRSGAGFTRDWSTIFDRCCQFGKPRRKGGKPRELVKNSWKLRSFKHPIWDVEPKIGGGKTPKSSHLFIGFGTIIFTIHFGGFPPYFWKHPYDVDISVRKKGGGWKMTRGFGENNTWEMNGWFNLKSHLQLPMTLGSSRSFSTA